MELKFNNGIISTLHTIETQEEHLDLYNLKAEEKRLISLKLTIIWLEAYTCMSPKTNSTQLTAVNYLT